MATAAAPTIETRAFHSLNPAYLDAILNNKWMSADDIALAREFIDGKKEDSTLNKKSKHFGASRERRVLQHLRTLREFSPVDYRKITLKHMAVIMPAIENARADGKPRFSQNTYRDTIAVAKMFLSWLSDNGKSPLTDKDLKKIGIPRANEHTITADDLLTEESRDAMIKACQNDRDRAIIALMFEAGLRPVEVGRLTFKDVEFTSASMNITTREKTGRERKIPAPYSKPYMAAWINRLPYSQSPDAVVFCSLTPEVDEKGVRRWLPLKDDAIRRQIKSIAGIAGIKNFRKLYQFRHTAVSSWVNEGLPERMVMQLSHGGDTKMLRVYYHVTHDEIERRLVGGNTEPVKKAPSSRICPKCGTINESGTIRCSVCESQLNVSDVDELRAMVAEQQKAIDKLMMIVDMQDKAARDTSGLPSLKGYKSKVAGRAE